MGNSCVTGACRSNKGQDRKLVPPFVREQTTFKWRIDGFSSLLDKGGGSSCSSVFEMMGHNWYMKLNPMHRKSGDKNEYVSLRLELARRSVRPATVVEAYFKFLIYDQSYGKHCEHQASHNFQSASTSSGVSCMMPLATLKQQSSGFLVNNSCVFGVEFIRVTTAKANDTSETLFVQKSNSIFNSHVVYTWEIEDFFALKRTDSSPEFETGGHKCSIIIEPSGSSNNGNYLYLALNMKMPETSHQNFGTMVELSICVKDQETGKHRKLTGRCQFSKNAPRWGWDKFMTLEEFKDSSKGYLVKTKCCVEAQVKIIGSSKTD